MANFTITYQGQLRCEAVHNASGTKILTDAPVDNHGRGEAFSPTDLVCSALATCIVTTMGIWAKKENIDFPEAVLNVNKHMQASPRKIAKIEVDLEFKNSIFTDEQKLKIKDIAHNCPVALSLHPDVIQAITIQF